MTTLREAAAMALDALEYGHFAVADQAPHACVMAYLEATDKLREALAEPDPEPVAWIFTWYEIAKDRHVRRIIDCEEKPNIPGYDLIPLYAVPPQRKPLTVEEIDALELPPSGTGTVRDFVRLIERAHGIRSQERKNKPQNTCNNWLGSVASCLSWIFRGSSSSPV